MTGPEEGAVVVRTGRPALLVVLAFAGFVLAGVLAALWNSLAGRAGFLVDGEAKDGAWTLVGSLLLVPLALVLGLAVVTLGLQLVRRTRTTQAPGGSGTPGWATGSSCRPHTPPPTPSRAGAGPRSSTWCAAGSWSGPSWSPTR